MSDATSPKFAAFRVLVVDDMPSMRRIVKATAKAAGFVMEHMEEAENGQDALDRLADKSRPIDFIISDWNMPVMQGIDLLRNVRAHPDEKIRATPFLMVTAEAKQENIVEAIKAKVSNYIVKPFTAKTFEEKVEKILANKTGSITQ